MFNKILSISVLILGASLFAADHLDSPAASADPAADITDLYSWMSADATKMNVVLNVHPNAVATSRFSDGVKYVLNFSSMAGYGEAETNYQLICSFDAAQVVTCNLGDETVTGDASVTAGISSTSGKLKVFAGLRNDPFFFNFAGFTKATGTANEAAGNLTFDENGCPDLGGGTAATLVAQLQQDADGNPGVDNFAGQNVLSLVVELDKTLVSTPEKQIVAVWGATHRNP